MYYPIHKKKKIPNTPPSVSIMKHNTIKHWTSVTVVFIQTGQHFHLSLKVFFYQLLLLGKQNINIIRIYTG